MYRAVRGRRRRRDRPGRPPGRRRPHAAGRRTCCTRRSLMRVTERAMADRTRPRGRPVGDRQHRHQVAPRGHRAPGLDLVGVCGPLAGQGRCGRRRPVRRWHRPASPRPTSTTIARARRRTASSTCRQGCDLDDVCRLLASGTNVVTTRGEFHHPPSMDPATRRGSRPPAREGGTSIHSTGSSPGFISEALPIVLTSIQRRLDRLTIDEFADLSQRNSPDLLFDDHGLRRRAVDVRRPGGGPRHADAFGPSLRRAGRCARRCPSTRGGER